MEAPAPAAPVAPVSTPASGPRTAPGSVASSSAASGSSNAIDNPMYAKTQGLTQAHGLYLKSIEAKDHGELEEGDRLERAAAEMGHVWAMHNLANSLRRSGDLSQANEWCARAAKEGLSAAQFSMGLVHENGEGVPRDLTEAVKWYELAAAQGLPHAITNLAVRVEDTDPERAFQLFRNAAAQNHPSAVYNFARCHKFGVGTPVNGDKAMTEFANAARLGQIDAFFQLGAAYSNGECGVEVDAPRGFGLYKIAAEHGHTLAASNLAYCFRTGHGTEISPEQAVFWYQRGAAGGDHVAAMNLWRALEVGDGCEANADEAIRWLERAYEWGNPAAREVMAALEAET